MKKNTANYLPSLLDELFAKDLFETNQVRNGVPAVNVKENNDAFIVEVAAPGIDKKDFNLELNKDLLTISYEKKNEDPNGKSYTRKEFSFNSFKRSLVMPKTADVSKIEASYNNGILMLTIPKKEEAKEKAPRKIAIS